MDALEVWQIKVAQRAGVSFGHLSQIMNGRRNPPPGMLKKLHGVRFQGTATERVLPDEVKVLGWRKSERSGMVVHGAGGRRGAGTEEAPCIPAPAWPRARRRSTPTAPGTTARAGCR